MEADFAPAASIHPEGKMATILLAEDDADIRLLVTIKLTQAGHQVRGFCDGLSAAADAREHPPDLAVLDIMMPGMSGLEVCQELRKDPATARIPVILLTALAQETDITAGLAAGADDYIVKPFSPRDFTIRVNAVLARVQAGALPGVTSVRLFSSEPASWPRPGLGLVRPGLGLAGGAATLRASPAAPAPPVPALRAAPGRRNHDDAPSPLSRGLSQDWL
jgi:CheY-like chemotaxis protein